jgi:hypothetical protein
VSSYLVSNTWLNNESIISTFGNYVWTGALYLEINGHYLELLTTTTIDGMSDCSRESCDTSISNMNVGALETIGVERECSTAGNEFKP